MKLFCKYDHSVLTTAVCYTRVDRHESCGESSSKYKADVTIIPLQKWRRRRHDTVSTQFCKAAVWGGDGRQCEQQGEWARARASDGGDTTSCRNRCLTRCYSSRRPQGVAMASRPCWEQYAGWDSSMTSLAAACGARRFSVPSAVDTKHNAR